MTSLGPNTVNVAGSIGGIAQSAGNLAALLGGTSGWTPRLLKASYDGQPFAVETTREVAGRRYAIHEYPYRESAWVEDLGKLPDRWEVTGYLVEDSLIYGGGPVLVQRAAMLDRCDRIGPKTLIHPIFGEKKNVLCVALEFSEERESGRVIEVRFTFMEAGERVFPTSVTSTGDENASQALLTGFAATLDWVARQASFVIAGAATIQQYVATAVRWYQFAITAIGDVKAVIGSVSTLSGNLGRFFGGANYGYSGGTNPIARPAATASDLLVAASVARAAVHSAGKALQAAAANPSDTTTLVAAVQTLIGALAATASDPADAVRLVTSLATFVPPPITTPGQFGTTLQGAQDALAALFRRYALAQLAVTLATYQPASQDDANAVREEAAALFDAEITIAGDSGDDASYLALRATRQAVCADLAARGADLSVIASFRFQAALPSLALALRMYRDPTREPGLVQQINPRHPAFCPSSFHALAI